MRDVRDAQDEDHALHRLQYLSRSSSCTKDERHGFNRLQGPNRLSDKRQT